MLKGEEAGNTLQYAYNVSVNLKLYQNKNLVSNDKKKKNLQTINAEEDVEKRKPSCIVGGM